MDEAEMARRARLAAEVLVGAFAPPVFVAAVRSRVERELSSDATAAALGWRVLSILRGGVPAG